MLFIHAGSSGWILRLHSALHQPLINSPQIRWAQDCIPAHAAPAEKAQQLRNPKPRRQICARVEGVSHLQQWLQGHHAPSLQAHLPSTVMRGTRPKRNSGIRRKNQQAELVTLWDLTFQWRSSKNTAEPEGHTTTAGSVSVAGKIGLLPAVEGLEGVQQNRLIPAFPAKQHQLGLCQVNTGPLENVRPAPTLLVRRRASPFSDSRGGRGRSTECWRIMYRFARFTAAGVCFSGT